MIVFSFINLKGGVGKTTVSTNVAIELMQRGLKVLFIDNDEQSNSSFFFNVDIKEKTLATLYKNPQMDIREVIYSTVYDNIDCIPAGYDLDIILTLYFDREKFKGMDRTSVLKNKLQTVSNDYDVCIIDNHPGINVATYNGLMATNSVIIVTTTDYYAEQGLKAMIKELENVKKDRMNYDEDYDEGIAYLQEKYQIPLILLTMGKDGSRAYYKGMRVERPGFSVKTIETTGAGDTFCGSSLNYILEHDFDSLIEDELGEMLTFANAAAAIVTTRKGAIRAMPAKEEVLEMIQD